MHRRIKAAWYNLILKFGGLCDVGEAGDSSSVHHEALLWKPRGGATKLSYCCKKDVWTSNNAARLIFWNRRKRGEIGWDTRRNPPAFRSKARTHACAHLRVGCVGPQNIPIEVGMIRAQELLRHGELWSFAGCKNSWLPGGRHHCSECKVMLHNPFCVQSALKM